MTTITGPLIRVVVCGAPRAARFPSGRTGVWAETVGLTLDGNLIQWESRKQKLHSQIATT